MRNGVEKWRARSRPTGFDVSVGANFAKAAPAASRVRFTTTPLTAAERTNNACNESPVFPNTHDTSRVVNGPIAPRRLKLRHALEACGALVFAVTTRAAARRSLELL